MPTSTPASTTTHHRPSATRPATARCLSPAMRVTALSIVLAAVAALLYLTSVTGTAWVKPPVRIPWWLLGVGFGLTDSLVVHVEVRDNAHSFTLNELPLVLGLLFCTPGELLLARLLAAFVMIVVVKRQAAMKAVFNLSLITLGTTLALALFNEARSASGATFGPGVWLAAFVGMTAVNVLDPLAITAAIRLSGGNAGDGLTVRMLVLGFLMSSVATTSLALVTASVIASEPAGIALIGVVATVMFLAYRGYATLHRRYESLEQLYGLTKALSDSPELEASVRVTLTRTREVLRANQAEIVLLQGTTDAPRAVRIRVGSDSKLETLAADELLTQPLWHTITNGQPVVVPRTSRDPRDRTALADLGCMDLVAVPLNQGGRLVGALAARDRLGEVSTFDDEDAKMLATLGNHVSVSLENCHLIDRLRTELAEKEHRALHDSLTGLGNREFFAIHAEDAIRRAVDIGTAVAIMLMDLDRFKEINDTLGHHQGDVLLRHVAARLRAAVPASALVARLGGDEFAVLLPHVRDRNEAFSIALALREAFETPFRDGELSFAVSASIGVAVSPDDGDDPATLLQRADIAMYVAKDRRGGAIELYEPERDKNSARRLAIAADLKHAIDDETLQVYYQPQADAITGRIVAVEALARWTHPTQGPIPPDEFIPLAESAGSMHSLTLLVLRTALSQLRAWDQAGVELNVAVNISARSLLDGNFPTRVVELLADHHVAPERLTLEVTESEMMAEPTRALPLMRELADAGINLSIDDFGTGYSSLSYLRRLPVREVKIDKSFVLNMTADDNDATIVRSIIDLARNLGLHVVAEGVEDPLAWQALTTLGCHLIQGYHLSRPLPPNAVYAVLQRNGHHTPTGALAKAP